MTIDDPQEAIEFLQRNDGPGALARLILPLATLFDLFPSDWLPHGLVAAGAGVRSVGAYLNAKESANREELLRILGSELKYLKTKASLMEAAHSKFIRDEFPGLLIDGLQRAERARTEGRIRRLAKILAFAGAEGTRRSSDYAEEMMRVAEGVDDQDVLMLGAICRIQGQLLQNGTGRVTRHQAIMASPIVELKKLGFEDGMIISIGNKLQGLGLLTEANNLSHNNLANQPSSYALLQKGMDFVTYIKGATGEELEAEEAQEN